MKRKVNTQQHENIFKSSITLDELDKVVEWSRQVSVRMSNFSRRIELLQELAGLEDNTIKMGMRMFYGKNPEDPAKETCMIISIIYRGHSDDFYLWGSRDNNGVLNRPANTFQMEDHMMDKVMSYIQKELRRRYR